MTSHRQQWGNITGLGKKQISKWRRMGAGWRENRNGWWSEDLRRQNRLLEEFQLLTLLRSGGVPKLSSAPSWTDRNSARRTRASSRETSAGQRSAPPPDPSSASEEPAKPGSRMEARWVLCRTLGHQLAPARSLPASLSSVPDAPTVPTDQAGQLGPQLCGWLVGAAATPGLTAGALGRQQGRGPEERPGSPWGPCLWGLSPGAGAGLSASNTREGIFGTGPLPRQRPGT